MNKKWIVGILIVALAGGGIYWFTHKSGKNRGGVASRIVTVKQGRIEETLEAAGEVAPLNRVEVKPPIQGRVEQLLVDEGDRVKAGQILAWMSSSDRAAIIDAARAKGVDEVKHWEDTYKPTPLVAPLSGVVILRNAVIGQTVDVGTVLFALSDRLIVMAHVDEVDIGHVHTGMKARITLDAYPQSPIMGHVSNILYEGKNVSNVITYGVKVEPEMLPDFFRSQMTANVAMIINSKEEALLLPAAAVKDAGGEKRVFVPVEGESKPEPRVVTTGIESGDNVEILSGLNAGDQVVITGKLYVPQKNNNDSPLVMSGRRPGSDTQPARTRQR